jgi:putative oxidoreductase
MTRVPAAFRLDASFGLFIFRVVVSFLFMVHGTVNLFGWPAGAGNAAEFGTWPGWWSGLIELVTGLLIISGLLTRAAAFLASGTMAVAYFWKHQPDGLLPIQNQGESAVLYCFAFLLLVFTGGGAWALDNLRGKRSVGRSILDGTSAEGHSETAGAASARA